MEQGCEKTVLGAKAVAAYLATIKQRWTLRPRKKAIDEYVENLYFSPTDDLAPIPMTDQM